MARQGGQRLAEETGRGLTIPDESSPALRALVKLFENSKGHKFYRRYVLERIDDELVFRQTEKDAAIEAIVAEILHSRLRTSYRRRIIKLPQSQ